MIVAVSRIPLPKTERYLYWVRVADYVPDFTVRHIFLSIHAGLRAFFRFKKGLVSHYCHPRF